MTRASLPTGWRGAVVRAALGGLRASLAVSPRPTVWLIRRQFAKSGAQLAQSLRVHRPAAITALVDQAYDHHADAQLDVYHPQSLPVDARLPTVVWTHGGAFVGGDKAETADYFRLIAAAGLTVVGVNYTRAPEARYPGPVHQLMVALQYLKANADRLHIDPRQIVLAGDSAGAHISAQAAAVITNSEYAHRLGVVPTIATHDLRGVVLCCGIFDLRLLSPDSPLKAFLSAVAWAYSGTRKFTQDDWFMSTMTIPAHITDNYPAAFVTVGNADPLAAHSLALLDALRSKNVATDTLLFAPDHAPALGHEYQFDIDLDDGRIALARLIAFIHRQTAATTDTTDGSSA